MEQTLFLSFEYNIHFAFSKFFLCKFIHDVTNWIQGTYIMCMLTSYESHVKVPRGSHHLYILWNMWGKGVFFWYDMM